MRCKYTSKKHGLEQFFTLCTKEWKSPTDYVMAMTLGYPRGFKKQDNFTTVPQYVTCPKCLDILIARKEKEITTMKETRAKCLSAL